MLWAAALAAPEVEAARFDRAASCVESAGPVHAFSDGPRSDGPRQEAVDRIALVVGVPCHADPSIPSLQFSSVDAGRMGNALEERGFAVYRLTTTVTRADFERALEAIAQELPPDGELVVYFSGHGVLRTVQGELKRYLVFSDADLGHIESTGLSLDALEEQVQGIGASRRTVVQDTCYAAGERGKGLGGAAGAKALSLPGPALSPQDTRLYASRFYEIATEEPRLGGSVYTSQLIQALDDGSADLDGDGCVGLLEAHARAAPETTAWRQGYQHPEWEGALDGPRCGPGVRGVLLEDGVLTPVEPGVHGEGLSRTRVAAGDWTTLAQRSRWSGFGGVRGGGRTFASAPFTLGAELGLQRNQSGWVGWIGLRGAGSFPRTIDGVRFTGGEAAVRLSALTDWGVQIGPALEAGTLVIHPRTTASLPIQVAPLGGVAARAQGGWGPLLLAAEVGVGGTLSDGRTQAYRLIVWPTVVGVLGFRL